MFFHCIKLNLIDFFANLFVQIMINKIMFGVVLLFAEINVVFIIIYLAFFALKYHNFS